MATITEIIRATYFKKVPGGGRGRKPNMVPCLPGDVGAEPVTYDQLRGSKRVRASPLTLVRTVYLTRNLFKDISILIPAISSLSLLTSNYV